MVALLSACDLFSEPEEPPGLSAVPKFESFGMTQRSYQVRPYTCGRAALRMVADRKIERDDIVWSVDTALVDLEDGKRVAVASIWRWPTGTQTVTPQTHLVSTACCALPPRSTGGTSRSGTSTDLSAAWTDTF
ncbi:MAG: hypothetical protein ABW123_10755 [Cystobacter sp.]